jgi:beta-mannosidase
MIATLDLPDDDGFNAELAAEVSELCDRLSGRPSVVVLSGGTETLQQPAMLGLPLDQISVPAVQSLIPAIAQSRLPGVEYVVSSPSGGELPFHPGSGVAHYFGVGAYLRPLSDATLSGVRFAAESLAFAVPPERASVDAAFGGARAAGHTPQWKAGVPRDLTASWDFEDVRDHYVRDLFGVDPMRVRYSDADRYLDLGRAACAEAMVSAFTQWRAGDRCAGALILTGRDLVPGAGWGIVDSSGRAKAPWFSLRRVLAPVAVALRDNGMNGMTVDLHNDQADPIDATLRLTFFGPDGRLVDSAERAVELAPRSSSSRSAEGLLGYFRDVNHAYGFGPASFGFVSATLSAADGRELARDGRFVGDGVDSTPTLRASFRQREDGTWLVVVETDSPAQWVALDVSGHEPSDNWFHLAPGVPVEIELRNVGARADRSPAGTVRALNARGEVVIERAGS